MWSSPSWTAVRGSATSSLGNVKYDSASPVLMCSSLETGWCNVWPSSVQAAFHLVYSTTHVPFADGFPAGKPLPSADCHEHRSFHELPSSTASPLASSPSLNLVTCSIDAWPLGALLNRLWCAS